MRCDKKSSHGVALQRGGEGKVKEETGKLFGNKNLQDKGNVEKNLGKAQAKYGDLKRDVKKDLEDDNE